MYHFHSPCLISYILILVTVVKCKRSFSQLLSPYNSSPVTRLSGFWKERRRQVEHETGLRGLCLCLKEERKEIWMTKGGSEEGSCESSEQIQRRAAAKSEFALSSGSCFSLHIIYVKNNYGHLVKFWKFVQGKLYCCFKSFHVLLVIWKVLNSVFQV